jgi:hypothetical protein
MTHHFFLLSFFAGFLPFGGVFIGAFFGGALAFALAGAIYFVAEAFFLAGETFF